MRRYQAMEIFKELTNKGVYALNVEKLTSYF